MYLYLSGAFGDIASATAYINNKLEIKEKQETIYGSQHTLLKNIAIYHEQPTCINKNHYKLLKIIVNHAPKLPEVKGSIDESLRTYLEVKQDDILLSKMITQQFGQG